MADFRNVAKMYISKGYSVIPVNAEKNPAIHTWTEYQKRLMSPEEIEKHFSDCWGIALLMGGAHNLTAIDVDLKYSLVHDFFERYKKAIPPNIFEKFYTQSTRNKGAHFIFSCKKIEHNQKLASRETTPEERHEVYMDNFQNLRTRGKALRIANNHKSLVLIETRGEGGYVLIAPTDGYNSTGGKIGELTEEEYDELMQISREFNEYQDMHKNFKVEKYRNSDVNPFEEFNERGDILSVLLENGWEEVYSPPTARSYRLKRAGNPSSKSSALLDKETRVFNVFSTSTVFDANKGYSPASTFVMLEADNDVQAAYEMLMTRGFGDKLTKK